MLLNEFLKERRELQELKKQVAALTAGLQKVSAQLEVNRLGPRTVVANQ
jgi:predicted  nucleic acid-binding Zn-ribbon protein